MGKRLREFHKLEKYPCVRINQMLMNDTLGLSDKDGFNWVDSAGVPVVMISGFNPTRSLDNAHTVVRYLMACEIELTYKFEYVKTIISVNDRYNKEDPIDFECGTQATEIAKTICKIAIVYKDRLN